MPAKLYTEIIRDLAKWDKPLFQIVPVNYGEFFLYPDWYKLLDLIKRKLPDTSICIPTNGILVDQEVVAKLASIPNIQVINFSINAFFEETYAHFTGTSAENLNNIHASMMRLKILRPDILLRASMVFDPIYCSDLQRDLFIEYWKSLAEVWILPAASACRGTEIKILRRIPCRSIFSDFVIGYDGKLSSCCFDAGFTLDLGNLSDFDGNVLKAWSNPKLDQLRKLHNEHRRQEIPLCRGCTFE